MGDDRSKSIPLHLAWLGTLCGSLLLMLADVLPFRLGFVRPETLFVSLTEVELAFVLLAWPAFLPSLGPSVRSLFVEGALLFAAAVPPAVVAANVSNVGPGEFLRAQAIPASLAALAAALHVLGSARGWRVGPWYVLSIFILSAGIPFAAFVSGGGMPWAPAISPFWAVARTDGTAAAVFSISALVFLGAAGVGRRKAGPA